MAAGNCCILKPSEVCSLTCLEMGAIMHDAGVPAGVFNVITGTGVDAGAPLRCDSFEYVKGLNCCFEVNHSLPFTCMPFTRMG